MMRRIGNGANTTIWGTAWLTSNGSGKIITSRPIYSSFPNMLGDLIDWNRGAWDLVVINQHMRACDASRILEVPIGYETSPDCFYWSLSKHGNCKVRYCYYQLPLIFRVEMDMGLTASPKDRGLLVACVQ